MCSGARQGKHRLVFKLQVVIAGLYPGPGDVEGLQQVAAAACSLDVGEEFSGCFV
jgi:hypothetical protein